MVDGELSTEPWRHTITIDPNTTTTSHLLSVEELALGTVLVPGWQLAKLCNWDAGKCCNQ